jgi:hypothetical protein
VTAVRRLVVAAALVLFVRPVLADVSAADQAFKKGRELLKAGNYAEACVQFEQSQALDPALGTLFNIAQCDERIGKLATALAAYREVIAKDTNQTRRQTASDNAGNLQPRVPRLVVQVPPTAKHVIVTLDGKRTIDAGEPVELDMGDYTIDVHADGMADYSTQAKIVDEGKTVTITAKLVPGKSDVLVKMDHRTVKHGEDSTVEPAPRSHRKLYGIAAMATGGAGLLTGVIFGGLASSKWSDAKAVCGGTTCTTQADADRASALGDQARSKANLSTGLVVAGGVIAAIGVVVYVTAPTEHAVSVAAHASPDGGSVTLSGRF